MGTLRASEAFYEQLKSLRIKDFPCGLGSWRQISSKRHAKYDCGSAQFENTEDLLELERSGPYSVDCSWSKETKSLRKIAIETPEVLKEPNFVMKHFTTLRIVNKNVSDIDDCILKFVNLKELILSANLIEELDGRNFPKGLEVLELAVNNVKDLSGLRGDNLSSLLHLGLAHNQVSFVSSRSLTPDQWPSLLSLDLSYNNLSDLKTTVEILKQLPVLRNLLLIGNPLYLSKSYHGLIIDNMPGLSFLDNAPISADDRHHFKSFSRIKDIDTNSSHVVVEIAEIDGVKKLVQTEEPDSPADYPKIEFKYHVEFTFMRDSQSEESLQDTSVIDRIKDNSFSREEDPSLQSVSTDELLWANTIQLNFKKPFVIKELTRMRDFLQNGVTFIVIGVQHTYVLEDPQLADDITTPRSQSESIPEKRQVKSASKDRSKDIKDRRKSSGKKSAKGGKDRGKKEKHSMSELYELPQVRKVVGSCHVPLASLLEGESEEKVCRPCKEEIINSECNERSADENVRARSAKPQSGRRSDINDKKKNKGEGEKNVKTTPTKGRTKDRAKSAALATKGTKGGKGKEKVEEINEDGEDDVPAPPPPLSISLEIKLNRWKNTNEAIHDCKN